MLDTLKKKYNDLIEPKSPSVLLVASGGLIIGLAGYILHDQFKTAVSAGNLAVALLEKGFEDFDAGDSILRVSLIKK